MNFILKKKIIKKIICLGLAGIFVLLTGCGTKKSVQNTEEIPANLPVSWYPDAKMNEINDEKWVWKDGWLYYEGSEYKVTQGIDVSSNQGYVDWNQVRDAGIGFVILRAGYRRYGAGIIEVDEYFYENFNGAKAAGLDVGVYFFSQAINEDEAREEAACVLDLISGESLELPVFFDTEEITYDTARTDNLSGSQFTKNALAFCAVIEDAGYTPGIYGNQYWLCNKLDYMEIEKFDIWLAKYTEIINYPYDISFWQYSESGSVPGISTSVDLNVKLVR